MKAWMVHDGEPMEGCQLVFAENRTRAKTVGQQAYPGDFEEWIYIRAWRQPAFDGLRTEECAVMDNDELPPDMPFYTEV